MQSRALWKEDGSRQARDTDYEAAVAFGRKHQADVPIAIRV
jgi:hypothetical protein